jgi:hypothetical protein
MQNLQQKLQRCKRKERKAKLQLEKAEQSLEEVKGTEPSDEKNRKDLRQRELQEKVRVDQRKLNYAKAKYVVRMVRNEYQQQKEFEPAFAKTEIDSELHSERRQKDRMRVNEESLDTDMKSPITPTVHVGAKRKYAKARSMPRFPETSPSSANAWQWCHSDGTWRDFCEENCALLDNAHKSEKTSCEIKESGFLCTIFLDKAAQTMQADRKVCDGAEENEQFRVRRWNEDWNKDPMILNFNKLVWREIPSWESQTEPVLGYPVLPGTKDYSTVASKIFDGSGALSAETHRICRVLRVQNMPVMSRYAKEKEWICRHRGECECCSSGRMRCAYKMRDDSTASPLYHRRRCRS